MKFLMPSKKERITICLFSFSFLMVFFFQLQAQTFPLKVGDNGLLETKQGTPFLLCSGSYSLNNQSAEQITYHFTRLSNLGVNALFVPVKKENANTKSYSRQIKFLRRIVREAALYNLLILIHPLDTSTLEVSGKSLYSQFKAFNNVMWVLNSGDFSKVQVESRKQLKAVYMKSEILDTLQADVDLLISDNIDVLTYKSSKPVVPLFNESSYSDSAALYLRNLSYAGLLKGSSGIIVNQSSNKKWLVNNPFYYQLHLFQKIFDTIAWQSFKPLPHVHNAAHNLFSPAAKYCDKDGALHTVFYHSQGGAFSLNLSLYKSKLDITWIQPSTGKAFYSQVIPRPAEQMFLPPYISGNDWLIIIKEEK